MEGLDEKYKVRSLFVWNIFIYYMESGAFIGPEPLRCNVQDRRHFIYDWGGGGPFYM
jgi:hypothetical protein